MIEIRAAKTGRGFRDFVIAADIVYSDDPLYVPQLAMERRAHLGAKNPYHRHAKSQYFVAYRDGKPAGRISAQIDELAQISEGGVLGHIGFADAADADILGQLLHAAEDWLREQGAARVSGPYSLSINDESGLLIEGFDTAPRMMMNYARPWQAAAFEAAGYRKIKDLIAFRLDVARPFPAPVLRVAEKAVALPGLTERPVDRRNLGRDLRIIMNIFNDAWAGNWGFVPMTEEEINYAAKNMKPLIRPEFARIVEIDGEPVAMIVALPDLNEALRGLGGRLLPFGWAKLLWRIKRPGLRGARVLLMGVREKDRGGFKSSAIGALLVSRLRDALAARGFQEVEMSWILEDNMPIIRLIESLGGVPYKRYRIYEKPL